MHRRPDGSLEKFDHVVMPILVAEASRHRFAIERQEFEIDIGERFNQMQKEDRRLGGGKKKCGQDEVMLR